MFTQFVGTAATVYGVLGALKTLLQTRQMLARRSSGEVSAGYLDLLRAAPDERPARPPAEYLSPAVSRGA